MAAQSPINPAKEFIPPEDECRALAARIGSSAEFQRAARLREFLKYVVDRKLAGAPHEITEVIIGHRVFGRPATYNTGDDSIVRTEARTLRQRLDRYFEREGANEPIILEIPRGAYVPVFRPRWPEKVEAPTPVEANSNAARPQASESVLHWASLSRRQWFGASFCTAALAGLGAWRWSAEAKSKPEGIDRAVPPKGLAYLESSDPRLNLVFEGAKHRVLGCVFSGDPVGDWYSTEPAGASRVFCMRDVSHQSIGAAVLGLTPHTLNMLRRFAASVARSRDWCGYWVISKDGYPPSDTYHDDSDFGYCLPANFDVMRAAYRQYLWTADEAYLDSVFSNFYDRTVTHYVDRWDHDHDGIMENARTPRVLPTYHHGTPILTGADLVAAQYAGYLAYAAIQDLKGVPGSLSKQLAGQFRAKAERLQASFNSEWWSGEQNRFLSAKSPEGAFQQDYLSDIHVHTMDFGIVEDGAKTQAALRALDSRPMPDPPQASSYFPGLFYRFGGRERAFALLLKVGDPNFGPTISEPGFAVIGAIATGLMGIVPNAPQRTVTTLPRLPQYLEWVRLNRLPFLGGEISLEHRSIRETALTNHSPAPIRWKAAFPRPEPEKNVRITINGSLATTIVENIANREPVVSTMVTIPPGETRRAMCNA